MFAIIYLFTFPQGWLISDEYSYVNTGIAISEGKSILGFLDPVTGEEMFYRRTRYPLGNSFWIGTWIYIFGHKWSYVGSMICVLGGIYFLYKSISNAGYLKVTILLLFAYPSLMFFAKSFMSGLPSFFISCVFCYFLFTKKESGSKWFLLSLLGGLSFWFRESNVLLLGGFCLIHFLIDKRWFFHYALGAIVGFLPRIISSYYFYDDPFQIILTESFSFQSILDNALVYFIYTMLFMPLGLFVISRYKGIYRWPLVISSFCFIALYLSYSFNATIYSGFTKGLITMGRFMLPLLPFFIIACAWHLKDRRINPKFVFIGFLAVTSFIAIAQVILHQEASVHKNISKQIYSNYGNDCLIYDHSGLTNISRYINPYHGKINAETDVKNLEDEEYMIALLQKFENVYIIQTINKGNSVKSEKTSAIDDIVQQAKSRFTLSSVDNMKIKPNLDLQVIKVTPK